MARRRWAVLGAAAALAALLLSWPLVWDAVLSGLLLCQVATPLAPGPLTRITDAPERLAVTFQGGGRPMVATLYRPARSGPGARPGAGLILVHGVNETGKDDERIVWLADLLARSGFTVLTPDFLGFKSLTLRTSDVEELVARIQHLAGRRGDVAAWRVGLIGFSYGAGPTIVAAADPRVLPLLIGAGVKTVSVPAARVATVRSKISNLNFLACKQLTERALLASSAADVWDLVPAL